MSLDSLGDDTPLQFDQLALERAVRSLCKAGFRRSPLTLERVKAWVRQFDTESEKSLAWLLLRHLVYRTTPQLESSLRQALKQAALHFLGSTGADQSTHWQDALAGRVSELSFLCGPPTLGWLTLPGKSGEVVTRLINRNYRIQRCYPHDVTQLAADERFLIVDDGTYTGQQLIEFFENWRVDYSQGRVAVVVALAHQTAIDALRKKFPTIPVFCGELLTEKNSLRWLSARWIADRQWSHEVTPHEVYFGVCQRMGPFETVAVEGFGSLGLMVAFEHGIPDDSLQLLWDRSNRWSPLIER